MSIYNVKCQNIQDMSTILCGFHISFLGVGLTSVFIYYSPTSESLRCIHNSFTRVIIIV